MEEARCLSGWKRNMGEERGERERVKETTEQNERTLSNDEGEEKEMDDNEARIAASKLQ